MLRISIFEHCMGCMTARGLADQVRSERPDVPLALIDIGDPANVVARNSTDHAGYPVDAERFLGARLLGRSSVDKRNDVFATALYMGLTPARVTDLDLAYAPPFNSVVDSLQIAATSLLRRTGVSS